MLQHLSCLLKPHTRKAFKFYYNGDCIECSSHFRHPQGYTQITFQGKVQNLHRVIFFLLNPEIDKAYVVRHTCNNTSCCNPAHLIHGTQLDNMRDYFTGECKPTIYAPSMRASDIKIRIKKISYTSILNV